MKIKEIIVVEGKDDTAAVKRAVDADTIETNGSALDEETIERIKRLADSRGVIIFTDPDYPGEKIRKQIAERVPHCKHAFLPQTKAKSKTGRIGVEYATADEIRKALEDAVTMGEAAEEVISMEALIEHHLVGHENAKRCRKRLGELLKIGYANGKQLHKRLMMFRITKEQFLEALQQMDREGLHDE